MEGNTRKSNPMEYNKIHLLRERIKNRNSSLIRELIVKRKMDKEIKHFQSRFYKSIGKNRCSFDFINDLG